MPNGMLASRPVVIARLTHSGLPYWLPVVVGWYMLARKASSTNQPRSMWVGLLHYETQSS